MKKLRMVEVEWVDSCSLAGWRPVEEHLEDNGVANAHTMGYVIRSNRKEITIVQTWSDAGVLNASFSIPRSAVRKIRYLEAECES